MSREVGLLLIRSVILGNEVTENRNGYSNLMLVRYSQYLQKYRKNTIIPYVYEEAKLYYLNQAKKAEEIAAGIKRQLEKDRIEIPYNPRLRRQKKKTLDPSLAEKGVRE